MLLRGRGKGSLIGCLGGNQPNRDPNKYVVGLDWKSPDVLWSQEQPRNSSLSQDMHLERDLALDNQFMGTNKNAGVNWQSTLWVS